jgi:hypothetical protein
MVIFWEGDPWPWRFSTAIAVYSDSNALVANNLIGTAELPLAHEVLASPTPNPGSGRPGHAHRHDQRRRL